MAFDFGPFGVRVNAIAVAKLKLEYLIEGTRDMIKDLPKKIENPQEVANTIFFLCSNQSTYVSGAEIEINGEQHV